MPTSNPWHIPVVLHFALAVKPTRILDIGIGMGAYGFLLRQFTDIVSVRINRQQWQTRIDGVEVFPAYRNPTWDFAYDQVHFGDIRDLVSSLPQYDLVMCVDVLEHFPREDSHTLIQELLKKAPTLIATTPTKEYPQGGWGGNPAETHHCLLTKQDFPCLVAVEVTGETTCFVCSTDLWAIKNLKTAGATCPRYRSSRVRALPRRILNKVGKILHPV